MNRLDRGLIKVMPDGTEKHVNPFTGTEVWFIPSRKNRPIFTAESESANPITLSYPEDYCNFCPARYKNTPPEKSRYILQNGSYVLQDRPDPEVYLQQEAEFRRIPNLFEIVTIEYWMKNFQFSLTEKNRTWKERYLSSSTGRDHVLSVIDLKLKYAGMSENDIRAVSFDKKAEMSDAFFGGGHELVIFKRHYIADAGSDNQLTSSGELSLEEHYLYFKFTIESIEDIYENNRYARYIAVYQNWLKSAGASFDHLHKQLVALDEWGVSLEREIELAHQNSNIYNEFAANYAAYNNNVICENDYAVGFVDLGHRHPTVAVYSKSVHCRPDEHTEEELRGFSDIVHAIHAASGSHVSCNEEWYYMPKDCIIPIPWHILIKWRVNIAAGFEGGTKIYVNPISLKEMRDQLVPRLYELRSQGKLGHMYIADECPVRPNSLQYYKNNIG